MRKFKGNIFKLNFTKKNQIIDSAFAIPAFISINNFSKAFFSVKYS